MTSLCLASTYIGIHQKIKNIGFFVFMWVLLYFKKRNRLFSNYPNKSLT